MGFYRFGFYLLLCSHQLLADTYWSHMPGFGSVQLTELNSDQHTVLSKHLDLSGADTKQWLDKLPDLLDPLSCSIVELQSQSLPAYMDASYRLVSYAGVLKWASDDQSKDTVWWLPWLLLPSLQQNSVNLADVSQQMQQPLLISDQQGGSIIVSGSIPGYFALQLNTVQRPEQLWSASSVDPDFEDLAGALAQPQVLLMSEPETGTSVLLPDTAAGEQKILMYKVDLLTGAIQARLKNERKISDLSGAFVLYDHNLDSVTDTLLFSTKAGQVWRAQIENNQFYDLQLIADLSGLEISDIQYIQALYAAVPIGGSGSDFHSRRSQWLVLLSTLQQQKSLFIVLKHQGAAPPLASDLVDRTLPAAPGLALFTDQDWLQIQQKNGWYSRLPGRLAHMPVVAAGVIYLRLINSDPAKWCTLEDESSALLALHLHHASSVYPRQLLPVDKAAGTLAVKANTEGGFALIEQNNQRVLIEHLLEISPECLHCTKTMQQSSFPRWQLMGTYHSEEGAYE